MSKNIYEAILAVMSEVSYVQKKRAQDSRVGYTLKTENAVIAAVRPAMMNHGIIMYPVDIKDTNHSSFVAGKYENHWNRIVATHVYRFHHAVSDTFVDVAVLGDGADTGDKAGNKSMTVSKKYALLEVFLLETGDDPDETPSSNVSTGGKQQKPPQPVPASPDGVRPWDANLTKQYLVERAKYHASHANKYIDQKGTRKGAMVAMLNGLFGGDQNRRAALEWLTTKASTKEWEDSAWLAFKDWIEVREIDGEWLPGEYVKQEANNIIKAAMMDQGQQEMEI